MYLFFSRVSKSQRTPVLERYDYQYDSNQQIIQISRRNSLLTGTNSVDETRDYVYDSNNRLIQSTVSADGSTKNVTYSYDSAGNRIEMNDNGTVTDYTYNGLNQLVESESEDERIEYSYDGAGNQICEQNCITGQITENSFSVKGELLESTVSDGTETILIQNNEYNGNGTRIRIN